MPYTQTPINYKNICCECDKSFSKTQGYVQDELLDGEPYTFAICWDCDGGEYFRAIAEGVFPHLVSSDMDDDWDDDQERLDIVTPTYYYQ